MFRIRPDKTTLSLIITTLLCLIVFLCFSQEPVSPISTPEHQKILKEYKNKADEFCAKNLNRFGLYALQNYDKAIDSLVAKEKEDTLAAMQKNYAIQNIQRKILTDSLKIKSTAFSQSKETYIKKYHGLLRKAGIAFVIWLTIVLFMLKWRNRLVKKTQTELDANIAQLKNSEQAFSDGEDLLKSVADWEQKNAAIFPLVSEIQKTTSALKEKLSSEITQGDSYKKLLKDSEALLSNSSRLKNLSAGIVAQHREPSQEKQVMNINTLCDQYADLAHTQMLNEDGSYACQFTKDFEKNLPTINVIPDAVGSLVLYVLNNAFNSVIEKQKKEIKGYVPKVSISTRILPRFLQIRVKDNGDGVSDEVLNQIYQPFYSVKPAGEGAGLGLYFGEQIIRENNGEIKIESELGNGTDVYLKFFLKS